MKNWPVQILRGVLGIVILSCSVAQANAQVSAVPELVTGTLNVVWHDRFPSADAPGEGSVVTLSMTTDAGIRIDLEANSEVMLRVFRGELQSGGRITLHVASGQLSAGTAAAASAFSGITETSAEQPLTGAKKWATVLCRYSDVATVTPVSTAYYQSLMGAQSGGLAAYWADVSYGKLLLDATTVVNWVNMPQPKAYYEVPSFKAEQYAQDCLAAANSQLFLPDFLGFTLVSNNSSMGGKGGLGGGAILDLDGVQRGYGMVWAGQPSAFIVAHEMGHAFGLNHSGQGAEYNSEWDLMARGGSAPTDTLPHVIAYHKERLGWIPEGLIRSIPAGNAAFELQAVANSQPEVLRIARVPLTDGTSYSIEARRRMNADVSLPTDGVLIHHIDELGRPLFADLMTRGGGGGIGAAWGPGDTFRDTTRNVAIRVASSTADGFVVFVSHGSIEKPFGFVDTPKDDALVAGAFGITGWALGDLTVTSVSIYRSAISGEPTQTNGHVFLGLATIVPGARSDIQKSYPNLPNNDRAGWGFMVLSNMLPLGGGSTFRVYAYASDTAGQTSLLGSKIVRVVNDSSRLPFGTIDTPYQGEVVAGTIVNFGWALTPRPNVIPSDGSTMSVYIDNAFVGRPKYGYHRGDIAALFPNYANSAGAVGFYVLDTTTLSNGLHSISWAVTDSAGNTEGIGSRFFTVDNARTTVNSNRTDSHMMSVSRQGRTYDFYGLKNDQGLLNSALSMRVTEAGRETRVDVSNGQVRAVHTSEGYTVTWPGNGQLTAVGPSGTFYDLPSPVSPPASTAHVAPASLTEAFEVPPRVPIGIVINKCGVPLDRPTRVEAWRAGGFGPMFPAFKDPAVNNRYTALIPGVDPNLFAKVEDACSAALRPLADGFCSIANLPDDKAAATIEALCQPLMFINPGAVSSCVGALAITVAGCSLIGAPDVCRVASAIVSPLYPPSYTLRVYAGSPFKIRAERPISDTTSGPLGDVVVDIGQDNVCEGTYQSTGSLSVDSLTPQEGGLPPIRRTYTFDSIRLTRDAGNPSGRVTITQTMTQHPNPCCSGGSATYTNTYGFHTGSRTRAFSSNEIFIPASLPPLEGRLRGGVIELWSPVARGGYIGEVFQASGSSIILVLGR